ncbi:MAG: hypothetical protein RIF41_10480 [Polyangiaceae bacterium]
MSTTVRHATRQLTALLMLAVPATVGCGGGDPNGSEPPPQGLVAGLDADPPLAALADRVEIRTSDAEGTELEHVTLREPFPLEHGIVEVDPDAEVAVQVEVFDAAGELLVRRRAETRQPPGEARLLRLRLNDECMAGVTGRDVSCPSETCVAGVCQSPSIASADLELYASDWATAPDSPCPSLSDVTVEIGADAVSFEPLAAGATMVPELGNQGLSHVWLSIRASGFSSLDLVTFLTLDPMQGQQSSAQRTSEPYRLDDDACRLDRPRYVLPTEDLWGTDMRLGVHVVDPIGNAGFTALDVRIGTPP